MIIFQVSGVYAKNSPEQLHLFVSPVILSVSTCLLHNLADFFSASLNVYISASRAHLPVSQI